MNLTCYIVDDEPHAVAVLSEYVRRTPGLDLVGTNTGALTALAEISDMRPHMSFLDVDMPEISGMEMAGLLSTFTSVVFTTSYREYAVEAFEKNAVDYLLKPIGYERFLTAVQKVRKQQLFPVEISPNKEFVFVKTEVKGKMLKVNIRDIRYIHSLSNYVEIFVQSEKIIAYLTLSELEEQLPPESFSRIQKSFIVAHEHIRSVENLQVKLSDGTYLPIGQSYSAAFARIIQPFLLVSKRKN